MHTTWIEMDCSLILSSRHHHVELTAEILQIPATRPLDDIVMKPSLHPHSALIVVASKVFKQHHMTKCCSPNRLRHPRL